MLMWLTSPVSIAVALELSTGDSSTGKPQVLGRHKVLDFEQSNEIVNSLVQRESRELRMIEGKAVVLSEKYSRQRVN